MDETFVCERCGGTFPVARMKEVMYEEGHTRVTKNYCPACLDEVMKEAPSFRGIVGEEKAAAIHVSGPPPS